jgi:hypothetical protein
MEMANSKRLKVMVLEFTNNTGTGSVELIFVGQRACD